MAGFPYQLYEGATRADAISGLDRRFINALTQLYAAAPQEVQRELGLNSAYRSAAVQQELWDKSDKTGHTVARPGKSKHQFGTAADLYGFGLGGGPSVSQGTKDWVVANAPNYGLYFPMGHEPWHIQLRDRHAGPLPGEGPGSFDYDLVPPVSPLGDTLASALLPEDPRKKFYSALASGVSKSLLKKGEAGPVPLAGDVVGDLPTVPLETPTARVPEGYLETPGGTGILPALAPGGPGGTGSLADLFKLKAIGAPPVQPGRRF